MIPQIRWKETGPDLRRYKNSFIFNKAVKGF